MRADQAGQVPGKRNSVTSERRGGVPKQKKWGQPPTIKTIRVYFALNEVFAWNLAEVDLDWKALKV